MSDIYRDEIYSSEKSCLRYPRIIDDGIDGDYIWIILSLNTHPTAYVGVKKDHPYYNRGYFGDEDEDDIDLPVHGGLTYSNEHVIGLKLDRWWFGWDYAHSGDYEGFSNREGGVKYTKEMIKEDIDRAIKKLREVCKQQP